MANTVVFNQKTNIKKNDFCFEDLKIGDVFMCNYPEAWGHFIKVEESVWSDSNDFNAICIEDGSYGFFDKEERVKKFIGEIALNGIFVEDKCEKEVYDTYYID